VLYKPFCAIISKIPAFSVDIKKTQTVGGLKNRIKEEAAQAPASIDAFTFTLYKFDIHISTNYTLKPYFTQFNMSIRDWFEIANSTDMATSNDRDDRTKVTRDEIFHYQQIFQQSGLRDPDYSKESLVHALLHALAFHVRKISDAHL
jgi:hypothetical protein